MRLFSLLAKIGLFILMIAIQIDELQLSQFYSGKRANRNAIDFYAKIIAGFVLFVVFIKIAQSIINFFYKKRHGLRKYDNFLVGVEHIFNILLVLGVFATILALLDVHIKEVFTSISIVFAGLAILTKDYVSNMISGMIITFSDQLSLGDNVKIGNHKGRILDITLQNIHLINDDDDYIYVPNTLVFNTDVLNYTKREIKRTSIEFEVDLGHMETVEILEASIIESISEFQSFIKPDSYYLRVDSIHHEYLTLKFQYILTEPNREMERNIRRTAIRRVISIINDQEKGKDINLYKSK